MSSTKIRSVFVTVFCVAALVDTNPVGSIPRQTAARQQGGAVLCYVSYQGQLRDILFNPIVFNQVLVNQGSAYNNNTGVFTAPIAGVYQFVFVAQLCRGDHNSRWYFMVNGFQKMVCHAQVAGLDTTINTCYCMETLKTGDQVWVKQQPESCAWASTTSQTITFSGVLLASDGVSRLGGTHGSGSSCPLPSVGRYRDKVSSSVGQGASLSTVSITLLICCLLSD